MRSDPSSYRGLVRISVVCWFLTGVPVIGELMPAGAIDIGSRPAPFLDRTLIETMKDVQLRMHSPVRRDVAMTFDAPWEMGEAGYMTLLKVGDTWRLYYSCGGEMAREYTCVAFSRDAIHWERPKLGLFEYKGSKDNNIIWTGENAAYCESHNFSPFEDDNPAAAPEQRYKAVSLKITTVPGEKDRRRLLFGFVSADGIHWSRLQDAPIMTEGSFDSHNVAFWDTQCKEYVCYLRIGREGKRSVARTTSRDFVHWTRPEPLDFGNTPLEHFYTNGIEPYFRNPQFYVGFPMRFVSVHDRNRVGFEQFEVDGLADMVFISSADGLHFNRPFMEGFVRPGLDRYNWGGAHGNATPAWHLVQTGPAEMSLYWSEHYGYHIMWVEAKGGLAPKTRPKDKGEIVTQLCRGTLRLDGLVSVNAPWAGGEMVTRPLVFSGKEMSLNVSTSAVGSVKVELQDVAGKPIPGFTMNDAVEIWGDEINRIVTWRGGHDVSPLAGKPIRLHVLMKDVDLYAVRFQ